MALFLEQCLVVWMRMVPMIFSELLFCVNTKRADSLRRISSNKWHADGVLYLILVGTCFVAIEGLDREMHGMVTTIHFW